MIKPASAFLLVMVLLAAPAAGAQAQSLPSGDANSRAGDAAKLTLSASGEVQAAPDEATISLGVQSSAPTAAAALRQNAEQMGRVLAALRASGIEDKAVQTSDISLQAQYDDQPNTSPRLTGYQASNQVVVTVHALAALGPALDTAVSAGANQVSGVSFGLSDAAAAQNAARQAAVKSLFAKAQLYAAAAGFRDARLVELSEGGGEVGGPVPMMAMARMRAASTPVSAGELSVRADVSGVFALSH